jgi:hypothetical protein
MLRFARCFFGDFLCTSCTSKESYPLARSDSGSSAVVGMEQKSKIKMDSGLRQAQDVLSPE